MKLPKTKGSRFVLIIGDNGAVLALMDGVKMVNRLFASSPKVADRREISSLISKNPDVPIYVMLDSMEQSYTQQTLPAVSPLSIGKLVKKRLERDIAETDIKSAIPMGRAKSGRRDWQYMFVSTPMTPTLAEWFSFIMSLPNKFLGIFLLPVEMERFIAQLHKEKYKESGTPEWQFLITQNKTGGFRQTVFKDKRIIFTRLVAPGKDNLPDIIAGSIEQETLNTLDYLRRLSFDDDHDIHITMVVAPNIKQSLSSANIRDHKIELFTPYEAAQRLHLPEVCGKEDKFADITLIANFVAHKPVLKFFNPETKRLNNLLLIYTWSFHAMVAIIPVFIIVYLFLGYKIFSQKSQISKVENDKAEIERQWNSARDSGNYNIDDATKITQTVTVYNSLAEKEKPPLKLVELLAEATQEDAILQSLSLRTQNGKGVAIFNMDFVNTGETIEGLFDNFEAFSKRIKGAFSEYDVTHSKLPEKLNFGADTNVIPIQVRVNEK